jgi:hypothetical protein
VELAETIAAPRSADIVAANFLAAEKRQAADNCERPLGPDSR